MSYCDEESNSSHNIFCIVHEWQTKHVVDKVTQQIITIIIIIIILTNYKINMFCAKADVMHTQHTCNFHRS